MSKKKPTTAFEFYQARQKEKKKQQFVLMPPEGVPINFELAPLSSRLGAQILDISLTYGVVVLLLFYTGFSGNFTWETTGAFFVLLAFFARVPYYILTELVWNGRTLAKRIVKIRVISLNGRRLEPYQVVVRNLLKEVEVFFPIGLLFGVMDTTGWLRVMFFIWLVVVLVIPFFSKKNQRLGDMIAGTCVVNQPRVQLSAELTKQNVVVSNKFEFVPSHLEFYGRFELQTLETILRQESKSDLTAKRDAEVVNAIKQKIGYVETIKPKDNREFLSAFYTEQRAYLEKKQLFGEVRESKHHRKT